MLKIPDLLGKGAFIRSRPTGPPTSLEVALLLVTLDNFGRIVPTHDVSFKCLPYQLSMVRAMPTMVVTGNGESGFDSGEGA